MSCDFTYRHYGEVIKEAKKLGFSFHTLRDYINDGPDNNFIILRHDVDISIKHALRMAEFENSFGVKSTYFVRVSKILDPFSKENSDRLKIIADLNHEIGLHYDSDIIRLGDFKSYLSDKKKLLERAAKTKICGAALHKVKRLDGKKEIEKLNFIEEFLEELDLEYDAYSDRFMKNAKYISDSSRRWKDGCMCEKIREETKLYILTHPIWWSSFTASTVTIFEELLDSKTNSS